MANSPASTLPRSKYWPVIGSLATAGTFVVLLYVFFDPVWMTNDDIGMSMIAHGYGEVAIGSPKLLYSNVLWGYLVRAIPEINGVLGYSAATIGVLILAGTAIVYGLFRLGVGYFACLVILALTMVRPVLFPQFTINAGLLMVGAIICWKLYAQVDELLPLVAGCLLAFFSYLLRLEEFFLILIVALPLIPWRKIFMRRSAKIAFATLVSAIAIATVMDQQAYQGDEWRAFNELEPVRALFTDFGAGWFLNAHPDVLALHGYSKNDVNLFQNYFLTDTTISNPDALKSMLSEIGPLPIADPGNLVATVLSGIKSFHINKLALLNGRTGATTLWHPILQPLVLAAMLLTLLRPSWRAAACWAMCIAAVFVLGMLGRPGILRVYIPLVGLLVIAPFLGAAKVAAWRRPLGVCVLLAALYFNASVFYQWRPSRITADLTLKALAACPDQPIVDWAAQFSWESVYMVLWSPPAAKHFRFFVLDACTLAPFTVAFTEQKAGRGLIERFLSKKGIPIIASKDQLRNLKLYCREHFGGDMKELSAQQYESVVVTVCQCDIQH